MRENIDENTEMQWQFEFPPEVQAGRQAVLDAYSQAMQERTPEAIKKAGALGWDWVARYPNDYVVWDAGEPLSMLADSIEATPEEASSEEHALSVPR